MASVESKTITWRIEKAPGELSTNVSVFNFSEIGEEETLTVSYLGNGRLAVTSSNSNIVEVVQSDTGIYTVKAIGAGNANISVNVSEGDNYGTVSKNISCKVAKTIVPIPTVTGTSKTFNGDTQELTIENVPSSSVATRTGTVAATNAGNYVVTYALTDVNKYDWEDGTTTPKTFNWSIAKQKVAIPTVTNTSKTYNGNSQSPTVSAYNSNLINVSGNSATNAGNYSVTMSLTNTSNYMWSDNTTTTKTVNWSIAKATGSISLDKSSISFTMDKTSDTITVTRSGDGAISAISNNTAVATVSISGNVITVKGAGSSGNAVITVNVGAGTNYTAVSTTCSVDSTFVAKKSFNETSWADIATVVKKGKAKEYWKVGDTKDMQFPAAVTLDLGTIPANTTYKVVILGFDHNSAKEGTNRLHLCIGKNSDGTKDICFVGHNMNSSNTNSGGWNGCTMKSWLNNTFYNALPTELKNVITECTKYTDNTGNKSNTSGNVTSTSQKIWLMAEFEVYGTRNGANQYEQNKQMQYDYYKSNSKVRYQHNSQGSDGSWWSRSPYYNDSNRFWCMSAGDRYANTEYGVVPCFTIS